MKVNYLEESIADLSTCNNELRRNHEETLQSMTDAMAGERKQWQADVEVKQSEIEKLQVWLPASVARRNTCGDSAARKKCSPRERSRKLEHCAGLSRRGRSAVAVFANFLFFFYTILASTERGASAVENIGSRATETGSVLSRNAFTRHSCGMVKHPCRMVMVIPLLLLSAEDNLMKCLPLVLSNIKASQKAVGGFIHARDAN